MKYIAIIILIAVSTQCWGQQKDFQYPHEENLKTESVRVQKARSNLKKAYEYYNAGDMAKTKYYLLESETSRHVNASFYYLLGQWHYDQREFGYAKRYWMRGYNKRGCWECKELVLKMEARNDTYKLSSNARSGLAIGFVFVFVLLGGAVAVFLTVR